MKTFSEELKTRVGINIIFSQIEIPCVSVFPILLGYEDIHNKWSSMYVIDTYYVAQHTPRYKVSQSIELGNYPSQTER